jgi:hypothetical protein
MTSIASRCLEDLILARLSVKTKSRPSPSEVVRSLYPFVELNLTLPEWRARFSQTLESLRNAQLVESNALMLTGTGAARLQTALGLNAAPSAKDWRAFKVKYLARLVLAGTRADRSAAVNPALEVLGDQLATPAGARKTHSQVVNAWLARTLDLGPKVTFGAVRAALLARELGVPARPDLEQVVRLAVAKVAGSRSARQEDVLQALTSRWLQGEAEHRSENGRLASRAATDANSTPTNLLEKVRAAALSSAVRRFGANKVFIASVWEALRRDPEVSALGELGFKQALAEAHRRGSLVLARADLVAAMDPHDVAASEVQHLNATYHFIQVEGEAP